MKVDMHVHTFYSYDAVTKIDELKKICNEKKLVAAITDHNTAKGWADAKKAKMKFIQGEEILTDRGDLIGLFMSEGIEKKGISFDEAVDIIRGQGALVYVPHPFDILRKGIRDEKLMEKADIIEVVNSKSISLFDNHAIMVCEKLKKLQGAGSDAHVPADLGNAYMEMPEFKLQPKDFLKALKKSKSVLRARTGMVSRVTSLKEKLKTSLEVIKRKKGLEKKSSLKALKKLKRPKS